MDNSQEIKITPEMAETLMERLMQDFSHDTEQFHRLSDILFCHILRDMGYEKAVDIFERHEKWYA